MGRLYFAGAGTDDFTCGSMSVQRIGSGAEEDCGILKVGVVRL